MFVKQISVFLENRCGAAADVLAILSKAGINIRTLSIAETDDYGIMRIIVAQPELAKHILQEQGIMVKRTDVIAISMPDAPGGISGVMEILRQANVSVEYMYAFVGRDDGNAVVVAKTDQNALACEVLQNNGVSILTTAQLL